MTAIPLQLVCDDQELDYRGFLAAKAQEGGEHGFEPKFLPPFLFDFQAHLIEWVCRQGKAALFADCGLGKTPMQLVWAENVVQRTNRPVLIMTPLAVAQQTVKEAAKFDIEAIRTRGAVPDGARIVITNYEQLHHFDPADFAGAVCDESSILKSFDGTRRQQITEFMRRLPYRLLCTATAAPNDYIELGTSSEAIGNLGHIDMLNRYFKHDRNTTDTGRKWGEQSGGVQGWRFKGHAEQAFWRWVCSWARAIRRPSDLGFEDGGFKLPPVIEREHIVEARTLADGMLFSLPAADMREEREERRRTIQERCEMAAELVAHTGQPAVLWCHLNKEGDLLERMIPGSRQIAGSTPDDAKEEIYDAFSNQQLRVLITKPKIGAWGLNWQHCAHTVTFASHSYEQYYQAVRRFWRFGQQRSVQVDLVASEGEKGIKDNLRRKSDAADRMFSALVMHMNHAMAADRTDRYRQKVESPSWL